MSPTAETRTRRRSARHIKRAWTIPVQNITVSVSPCGGAEARYEAEGRYWLSSFDRDGGCFGHFPAGPCDKA